MYLVSNKQPSQSSDGPAVVSDQEDGRVSDGKADGRGGRVGNGQLTCT
jgi:hypothetical protein